MSTTRTITAYTRTSPRTLATLLLYLQQNGYAVRSQSDLIDLGLQIMCNSIEVEDPAYQSRFPDHESAVRFLDTHIGIKPREKFITLAKGTALQQEQESDAVDFAQLMEEFHKAQQLLEKQKQ